MKTCCLRKALEQLGAARTFTKTANNGCLVSAYSKVNFGLINLIINNSINKMLLILLRNIIT